MEKWVSIPIGISNIEMLVKTAQIEYEFQFLIGISNIWYIAY